MSKIIGVTVGTPMSTDKIKEKIKPVTSDDLQGAVVTALQEAKDSGAFDGPAGADGLPAAIVGVTATTDNNYVGQPTVEVALGGTERERTFHFNFRGIKGEPGEQGESGNGTQGDWSVNNEKSANFIKGRTHWKEESGIDGEVIPETAVSFTASSKIINGSMSGGIVEGNKYVVTWSGTNYVCTAKDSADGDYIGNGSLFLSDLEDTGEPFCVLMFGGTMYQLFKATSTAETITVKVAGVYSVTWHKLDKGYLTDNGFDPRYYLRMEFEEAENNPNTIYHNERQIGEYHFVGDILPSREEIVGSVIEWSQTTLKIDYQDAVTESMIGESPYGEGYCIYCDVIWDDTTFPAAAIQVITEPNDTGLALGFKKGVYFFKFRQSIMVNGLSWGGERRIHKELLPHGYPHLRLMETVLPETVFDFSAADEVACDAIPLTKREWYLVTCRGIDFVVQAKTLVEDSAAVGIVLGDLSSELFSFKVLDSGMATVLYQTGLHGGGVGAPSDDSAVSLSVRRIIPFQMGAQYLPSKLVVKVTDTNESDESDSEGSYSVVMDHTLQDITDAFNAGWEVSCDLAVNINGNVFHVLLPLTQVSGQAFFAGFAGTNMLYTVTTDIQPESVMAYYRKTYVSEIDRTVLTTKIEGVLK